MTSVVSGVALTASAFEHDREAFMRAGCDGFVAKPYREEEIYEALATHLGVRFRYADGVAGEAAAEDAAATLTAERLAAMPAESRADLFEAAMQGDLEAAYGAIDRLREHDAALADELRVLVRGYKFDELLELIE